MPHITLEKGVPGIRSLALYRPDTAKPLYELVQILLRGPSTLSEAERELIAGYVSKRNDCFFCGSSHAAAARCLYGDEQHLVDEVLTNMQQSSISDKMKALLNIAGKVQLSGKQVLPEDVIAARVSGADDGEIHDTVLIAATFGLFNRYVDGLATYTPADAATYEEMGKRMAKGYMPSKQA